MPVWVRAVRLALLAATCLLLLGRSSAEQSGGSTLFSSGGRALASASADFDEDGEPDVIAAYPAAHGGVIVPRFGSEGRVSASATLRTGQSRAVAATIEVAAVPDFLGAGDFDADGHFDLVFAVRGGRALYFLPGDGRGNFAAPVEVSLPGEVVALASGDVNRRDGLADVVVAVRGDEGPALLVFESPEGASRATPEAIELLGEATAIAIGDLDGDHQADIAVAAGKNLMLFYGRDRRLSWDEASRREVPRPAITSRPISFDADSMSIERIGGGSKVLAVLSTEGAVHLFEAAQDWVREMPEHLPSGASPGSVLADLPRGAAAPDIPHFAGATFLVTNTNDSGAGSLRQAVLDANANPGPDNIAFNIPGSGPFTINVSGLRLTLTDPVTIDATTQPGYAGAPRVEVVGQFLVLGGDSTLRGLSIHSPGLDGFGIYGEAIILGREPGSTVQPVNGGNVVEGCYIGLRPDGADPGTNARRSGIVITSPNNRIGGASAAARNVISAYRSFGIAVFPSSPVSPDGNLIQGNFIGTTIDGTAALGNGDDGIILAGSSGNTIGGVTAGAGNLISGNGGAGLRLRVQAGVGATNSNLIQGNFIGTDRTGTAAVPNGLDGIILRPNDFPSLEIANNLIGGTTPAARNLISGNLQGGIWIGYGNPHDNLVQGNYIGTRIDGVTALGNGASPPPGATHNDGIFFEGPGGNGVTSGPSNHVIGGTVPGAGNVIAFSSGHGVSVMEAYKILVAGNTIFSNGHAGVALGFRSTATIVSANSIFSNTGLGIDNITAGPTEGPTPNDSCDTDILFTNPLQNFPDLTLAASGSSTTLIKGSLNSTPNTAFTLEFFSSPVADASGFGEGQTFLGSAVVTTSAACVADFSAGITLPVTVPPGHVVTATASDANGSTSEFSAAVPTGVLTASTATALAASPNPAAPGQTVVLTATVTGQNPTGTVKFQEGSNTLGTATLNAGTAVLNIGTLPLGSHSITAAYQGDSANQPSTSAPVAVMIANLVDLGIAIGAAPNPASSNEPLVFTLTVTNLSATPASAVLVDHTLPGGVTFNSATATQGSCLQQSATLVRCSLGTMAGNGSASITVTVTPAGAASLASSATVSSSQPDSNLANNTAQITVPVDATDLAVAITAPDPVANGQQFTYTVTVRNNGSRPAASISLFLELPASFTFFSGAGAGVQSCRPPVFVSTQAVCRLDDLPPGGQIVAALAVQPGAVGSYSVKTTVNSLTPDSNPSNNEQTWRTTVAPSADLAIQITGAAGTGGAHQYTVVVRNSGPNTATGIALRGFMGGVGIFDDSKPNSGGCVQSGVLPIVCDLNGSSIAPGAQFSFVLFGKAATPGIATLRLTVTGAELDPAQSNNTAEGQVTVSLPTADIDLFFGVAMGGVTLNLPLQEGDVLETLFRVSNSGPQTASGVTVSFQFPPADQVSGGVPAGCLFVAPGRIVCSFADISPGSQSFFLEIRLKLVGTGTHTFTATARANEYDPAPAGNTKTFNIPVVVRQADVSLFSGLAMGGVTLNLPLEEGDEISWLLRVNDNGPRAATGVTVALDFPSADVLSGGVPPGCLLTSPGRMTCRFPDVAPQSQTPFLEFTVRLRGTGTHSFKATVLINEVDPNPSDNTKTLNIPVVVRQADLSLFSGFAVNGVTLNLPLVEGDVMSWLLRVSNGGPRGATGVSVSLDFPRTDTMPGGVPSGCLLVSPGKMTCSFPDVAAQSQSLFLEIPFKLAGAGVHVFTATARANEVDPNPGGNTKSTSIPVIAAPPKLTGSYTLSRVGGQILADVKLTNSGGSTAYGAAISSATLDAGAGPLAASIQTGPLDIPKGGSATVRVVFSGSAFAPGSRALFVVGGAYTGGSFGMTFRVLLP